MDVGIVSAEEVIKIFGDLIPDKHPDYYLKKVFIEDGVVQEVGYAPIW